MDLIYVKANELDRNVKCSVHKTGKLGFNENAIRKLNVDVTKGVMIAYSKDDTSLKNLYIEVVSEGEEGAFKVSKAGDYFYLNTKPFFDKLGIDYLEGNIRYEIVDFELERKKMYKLTKIPAKKKRSNTQIT